MDADRGGKPTKRPLGSAAKRRKLEYNREYQRQRKYHQINIMGEIDRWNQFKRDNNVVDDEQAAQMLLDHYDNWKATQNTGVDQGQGEGAVYSPSVPGVGTSFSTPAKKIVPAVYLSEVSSIHGSDSNKGGSDPEPILSTSKTLSVIDASFNQHDITHESIEVNVTVEQRNGSTCIATELDTDFERVSFMDDDDDCDYVPDTLEANYKNIDINYEELPIMGEDDEETLSNIEDVGDGNDVEEIDEAIDSDIQKESSSSKSVLDDHLSISFDKQLEDLAKMKLPDKCGKCESAIEMKCDHIGTATVLKWICVKGHKITSWCSQPLIKKIRAGNFLMATNILLSGNNYEKINLLCKFMNMGCVNASSFYRIQHFYCVPVIKTFWNDNVKSILDNLRGNPLILLGDGQNDSPGHCAQYLNYNMIEESTGLLVHVNSIDKREAGGKSPLMELIGFKRALKALEDDNQIIAEVVTDAHIQIKSFMSKNKPEVKHSNDIWHGAKSIIKQISKATCKAENKPLAVWSKDIVNHFWWCAKNCEQNAEKFKAYWRGILHHVCNRHEWTSGDGLIKPQCQHPQLPEDYNQDRWLQCGSKPHIALENVVFNSRLLKSIPYFVNFRHTGDIELFHSMKLMYTSKRHAYSPPIYHIRCLLAAIDFNKHKGREAKKDKDGNIRYARKYSKRAGNWTVYPIHEEKEYNYIPILNKQIIEQHLSSTHPLTIPKQLSPTDPRKISRSIAKTPAPSVSELVKEKQTRF